MKYFVVLIFLILMSSVITIAETTTFPQTSSTSTTIRLTPKSAALTNTTPAPLASAKTAQKVPKRTKATKKKLIPPPTAFVGPPKPPPDIAEILYPDEIADTLSTAVVGLANRIDSFFGSQRSDDEKNGSTLRIVPSYTYYEHKKSVTELGINLNLKLKNLESKAKKIEKAFRDEFIEKPQMTKEKADEAKKNKEPAPSEEDWHYNFESKLASRPAIYYSGKLRARKNFTGVILLHHFAFSAGWDTDDHFSQITSFDSDKALNEFLLFRFGNEANWYITEKLVQATHGPSLIHSIDKYNSVSYNFRLVFGNEKNKIQHMSTVYSINYRHGTPSQRIFIDLIPSYTYSKDDYFSELKSLEIRFEYFFGDL